MTWTLFSSKKQFNQWLLCDWGKRRSAGGVRVSSSKISNCAASHRRGLDQVVSHLNWDGHPFLQESLKQLTTLAGAFTLPRTRLSNSSQVCSTGFRSGDTEGAGKRWNVRGWRGFMWCGVLHRVWRCRVEILRRATFDAWNETERSVSIFEQYINISRPFIYLFIYLFFFWGGGGVQGGKGSALKKKKNFTTFVKSAEFRLFVRWFVSKSFSPKKKKRRKEQKKALFWSNQLWLHMVQYRNRKPPTILVVFVYTGSISKL